MQSYHCSYPVCLTSSLCNCKMEQQGLLSLPLSSCAAKCIQFPDSPPLTPALDDDATPTTSTFTSTATTTINFTPSALITPRTPRKPAHPFHSASINREKSAIISFKMVQECGRNRISPSLHIISSTPSRQRASVSTSVRRRLWVLPGEVCESFMLESHTPRHYRHHGGNNCLSREELKDTLPPKSAALYGDGIEADDEMDGNSPESSVSPPYSPGYHETTSEAAAKPSSSSYPHPHHHTHHQHLLQAAKVKRGYAQHISPKVKSSHKSKTCASCKTKKTPLWRDSEDGIPYCNACGIRFKKYRVRCSSCLYIPRKDEREVSKNCCHCGSLFIHCKFHGR